MGRYYPYLPIVIGSGKGPYMRIPVTVSLTVCLAVAALAHPHGAAQTAAPAVSGATRTVYVTAVDRKGVPVDGLTASDFTIKEDGKLRTVVAAQRSTAPMTVALMIDDSGLGLQSIREGAGAFVTRLRGLATIALITTAGRNIRTVDYTDNTAALIAGLNRTYGRNQTGAFLTDGILEVATEFRAKEVARPVIVSVGVEGVDFSQVGPSELLGALQRSRTQLYMIRLGRIVIGESNPAGAQRGESLADEQVRFNSILGQAPSRTGGRIEQLSAHTGIPRAMEAVAVELAGQYELTYGPADPAAIDARLEISSLRRDVRVRVTARVGPPRK